MAFDKHVFSKENKFWILDDQDRGTLAEMETTISKQLIIDLFKRYSWKNIAKISFTKDGLLQILDLKFLCVVSKVSICVSIKQWPHGFNILASDRKFFYI